MAFDYLLLTASVLILASIGIARLSNNLGVPVLLLFLGVGMLAGSEGPGGVFFEDARLAQSIGIVCLIFILFAGGLETRWSDVRPVLLPALTLASVGVLLTALAVGLFAHYALGLSLLNGFLLGAIISSTDAAAVFSVLRVRRISLRGTLQPLIELESGSNDPMAVFLTVGILQLIAAPDQSPVHLLGFFVQQMGIGAIAGVACGQGMRFILNRVKLPYEGMYPVFALAYALLSYSAAAMLGGSGFLAVYLTGIVAGKGGFIHRASLVRFLDGLAWLSQIVMFLTLGLLVYPSHVWSTLGMGLLTAGFLMFCARPLSVFGSLALSRYGWREKIFISWVGLRGAIPIILATYPMLAGLHDADTLFNIVFFIVLTSALMQGWSIPALARVLRLRLPERKDASFPLEFTPQSGMDADLVDILVPARSRVAGKPLVELGLPRGTLVVLLGRGDRYVMPDGETVLEEGDTLLVLVSAENLPVVRALVARAAPSSPEI